MDRINYLALPIKTWLIVGGMFIVSSILPLVIGLILKAKKVID